MHRGKIYPYHPAFWTAPAWFWPGFVPWKLRATVGDTLPPPWNVLFDGLVSVSEPGEPSADYGSVEYLIPCPPLANLYQLVVTLDLHGTGANRSARWRMTIGQNGIGWATAFALQPYPQYLCKCESWDYTIPAPPYTSASGPDIVLLPATYAQGGSPWD